MVLTTSSPQENEPIGKRNSMITPIVYEYRHNVEKVVDSFFNKYPSPMFPMVLAAPIVEEKEMEDGKLYRKRHLNIKSDIVPRLFRSFFSSPSFIFEEESYWDKTTRTLSIKAENVSFSSIIKCTEESEFSVHDQNATWTSFEQAGGVEVGYVFGPLRNTLKRLILPGFRDAAEKSCRQLEEILDRKLSAIDDSSINSNF